MANNLRRFGILLLLASSVAYSQSGSTKVAYIKDNNLFVQDQAGRTSQLTRDGVPKDMPLWSKDGSMVAFDRRAALGSKALANIVVVSASDGRQIADVPILPNPGQLRYVEGLEWLTSNAIAVSGSIDPSTTQYVMLTLPRGEVQDNYFDQGDGAAFSADGKHIAYIEGSPHFTPEAEREPNLQVDGRRLYPGSGVHVVFVSAPSWSPDDSRLSIVAQDFGTGKQSLVICSPSGRCESKSALPQVHEAYRIFWQGQDLLLTSGAKAWVSKAADGYTQALPTASESPLSLAVKARQGLQARLGSSGGEFVDVWCEGCAVAQVARRTPLR